MSVQRTFSALILIATVAVGCTASGAAASATPAAASQAPAGASQAPASAAAATVAIGSAKAAALGSFLTGPDGMTLYTHTGDTATSSSCTGGCATAWPPLTLPAGSQVAPASGITGTFGTLVRADGTTQVTYAGLPLYGWQGDKKPGDITGENVNGFFVATIGGPKPAPSDSAKPRY